MTGISPTHMKSRNVIAGATFLARNCAAKNARVNIVMELQRYIRVDAFSKCLRNAQYPSILEDMA